MAEKLTSSEKTEDAQKDLKIALHYTSGDAEKAKLLLNGTYKDAYAIKVRFSSSSLYGAFILIFHKTWFKLLNFTSILTPSYTAEYLDISMKWQDFEQSLEQEKEKKEHDDILLKTFRDLIVPKFTISSMKEVSDAITQDDNTKVMHVMQKLILSTLGLQRLMLSVKYEETSSLDVEKYSITSEKLNIDNKADNAEDKASKIIPFEEEEDKDIKNVKLRLIATLVVSPIKGKSISELALGDRIKVMITDDKPLAEKVVKALHGYKEDGTRIPVTGVIKSIKYIPQTGYKIYAFVAKGVLAEIIEEEKNIKVALENYTPKPNEELLNAGNTSNITIYAIGILITLLIILIIILVKYLK